MKKTSTKSLTDSHKGEFAVTIRIPRTAVYEMNVAEQITKLVKAEANKLGKFERRVWIDLLTAGAAEKGWVIE